MCSKLYKILDFLLPEGVSFQLPCEDKSQQVQAVVSFDKSEAIVMIKQLDSPSSIFHGQLRLSGLEPDALYFVSVLEKPTNYQELIYFQPSWIESGCELLGHWCEKIGLMMPILDPETVILIKFQKVSY